jgi:hypothetical protein
MGEVRPHDLSDVGWVSVGQAQKGYKVFQGFPQLGSPSEADRGGLSCQHPVEFGHKSCHAWHCQGGMYQFSMDLLERLKGDIF